MGQIVSKVTGSSGGRAATAAASKNLSRNGGRRVAEVRQPLQRSGPAASALNETTPRNHNPNNDDKKSSPLEMPPDFIQFLKDAGPLREPGSDDKKPRRRLPRLPRHLSPLANDETAAEDSTKPPPGTDQSRHRQAMPLAEKVEGYETMRTHSFSTRQDLQDPRDFGLDVLDFYQLLTTTQQQSNDPQTLVNKFYDDHVMRNLKEDKESSEGPALTEQEQERHRGLLKQAAEVLELPVVLKDTDGITYVGVSPHRVEDLVRMQLQEVPKEQVKLVLEDLVETRNSSEEPKISEG